jgi:hypothetical protein
MILEEYNFKDILEFDGIESSFYILKFLNYKNIEVKNRKTLFKILTKNNEAINDVMIYYNGEKYNLFLNEKSDIMYMCRYSSDYRTKILEKYFIHGFNKEYHNIKDNNDIIDVIFLFYDMITDVFNKLKELKIE